MARMGRSLDPPDTRCYAALPRRRRNGGAPPPSVAFSDHVLLQVAAAELFVGAQPHRNPPVSPPRGPPAVDICDDAAKRAARVEFAADRLDLMSTRQLARCPVRVGVDE